MPENDGPEQDDTLISSRPSSRQARGLLAGDIIGGNYKIKSVIARGGMGVIYRAEHMAIHRDVALKALAPEHVDETAWQRFEAEGKAIAKLDHHNIVKVYDMGTDGADCLYYVMDMLHGMTLAQYLKSKKLLDVHEMIDIFDQVCAGLGYAHARGIVHRDLKPSNIFLCKSPYKVPLVKIIDYGLVKLVGEANRNTQSLTAMGIICGSPPYMSPEQCAAGKIDLRADIYSLGCTIFESLTGEPPFKGRNALETMQLQINSPVPKLRDFRPDKQYSSALEELVARMLEKFPAQRQQSMAMVAQDLARIKEGKSISKASTFGPKPLYEMDKSTARLNEPEKRTTDMPLGLVLTISAIGILVLFGAGFYFFLTQNLRHNPSNALGADSIQARDVFAQSGQISNGIVLDNGMPARVFNFPEVSIGTLCWGQDIFHPDNERPAKGKVVVPPNLPVTLRLDSSPDCYVLHFPSVLSKIGPEDITALRVVLPDGTKEDDIGHVVVGPEFLQAISQWREIHLLELHHCTLPQKTVLALRNIMPVQELELSHTDMNCVDLAKVAWLPDLRRLDIRYTNNVDPVLFKLRGSTKLATLMIDFTSPSKESLAALASCPNLHTLSVQNCEIDDDRLDTICNIISLHALKMQAVNASTKTFLTALPKLKNLRYADIGLCSLTDADVQQLSREMPRCDIKFYGDKDLKSKFGLPEGFDSMPKSKSLDF